MLATLNVAAQSTQQAEGNKDYRDSRYTTLLGLVEKYHWTIEVQMLKSGAYGASHPGPDIKYVLRYFPNHPGALDAMVRLWRSYQEPVMRVPPRLAAYETPEYYFKRAIDFFADDGIVRVLYGSYLFRIGRKDEALVQYEAALALDPDSPEIQYNAGLFFATIEDYDRAVVCAKLAYGAGFPLPGLRSKLEKMGVWDGVIGDTNNTAQADAKSPGEVHE